MFRSLCRLACIVSLTAFVAACGGGGDSDYGDILHDKTAMNKLVEHVKGLDKNKEVKIFQGVPFTIGSANFNIQDPEDPAKVVHYSYSEGRGWKATPVTLTGDGDLEDNLTLISEFRFDAFVDFVLASEELLKKQKYKNTRIDAAQIKWSWNDGSLSYEAGVATGEPGKDPQANFKGTPDGVVTEAFITGFDEETKQHFRESIL